jgi:tRNA(fMet)-specific endonuclease VapC
LILDTNALSALADGEAALEPILRNSTRLAIPVIVLGEFRYGISQSRYHAQYDRWLSRYLRDFQVLEIDESSTVSYAEIRAELKKAGTPIPANDAWIAALCRHHSLPIISRDRHFDAVRGLTRVSW